MFMVRGVLHKLTLRLIATLAMLGVCVLSPLRADAAQATPAPGTPTPSTQSAGTPEAGGFRNFYEVLDDLLGDFEYDLKNGQVAGLKDLAIRNIATSENIPASFKQHLELVVTERVLRTSTGTRMIQCLPCRSKRTTMNGDQVVITSPETNPGELSRIAKLSGIQHFMDLAFSYQPTGMVLSMTNTDPESGAVIWSRSYNSETSRASAFRRGVDYTQAEDSRKQSEYLPTLQYRVALSYLFEPNSSPNGVTGCLAAGFRMMERYDNRKKEVGFEADYIKAASSLGGTMSQAEAATNIWGGLNLTLLFVHAWNFIGPEENYNQARGSVFAAVGGTYASGYLGGLIRGGYEWRLAKHWAVSAQLGYRPTAARFVSGTSAGQVSGLEYGATISGFFW